jgi:hypothetical protein
MNDSCAWIIHCIGIEVFFFAGDDDDDHDDGDDVYI